MLRSVEDVPRVWIETSIKDAGWTESKTGDELFLEKKFEQAETREQLTCFKHHHIETYICTAGAMCC